jgi:hypothetical protein
MTRRHHLFHLIVDQGCMNATHHAFLPRASLCTESALHLLLTLTLMVSGSTAGARSFSPKASVAL